MRLLRREPFEYRLTSDEMTRLATYNGERSRGIAHTPEYAARMADLQQRFNQARDDRHRSGVSR